MIEIELTNDFRDLNGFRNNRTRTRWPSPDLNAEVLDEERLRIATPQWVRRTEGTYFTLARAARFYEGLLAVGAPLELIEGMNYVNEELTRHLSITLHLTASLLSKRTLSLEDHPRSESVPLRAPDDLLSQGLELFGFTMGISVPIYEALGALSSDEAISELVGLQEESMAELTGFGSALLVWLATKCTPRELQNVQNRVSGLFSAYETLCHGSPEQLDELAGAEITVEEEPGNLGSLAPRQLAAIFYHSLSASIFPLLSELGWAPEKIWRRHYREAPVSLPLPLISALGTISSPKEGQNLKTIQ